MWDECCDTEYDTENEYDDEQVYERVCEQVYEQVCEPSVRGRIPAKCPRKDTSQMHEWLGESTDDYTAGVHTGFEDDCWGLLESAIIPSVSV